MWVWVYLFVCLRVHTIYAMNCAQLCCWCCWCSGDNDATAHSCYLHSLSTHLFMCLCMFELRDILRRVGNTQTAHTYTHTVILMIPIPTTSTHTRVYRLLLCVCVLCMRPCFVSNMSSVVCSASLICYTAIARSSYSSFSLLLLLSASMCSSVSIFFHLLSVRIENKTHRNYGNRWK